MLWKHKEGIHKLSQGIVEGFSGGVIYMETQRIHSQAVMVGRDEECFL